jgi:hypothetical protein
MDPPHGQRPLPRPPLEERRQLLGVERAAVEVLGRLPEGQVRALRRRLALVGAAHERGRPDRDERVGDAEGPPLDGEEEFGAGLELPAEAIGLAGEQRVRGRAEVVGQRIGRCGVGRL